MVQHVDVKSAVMEEKDLQIYNVWRICEHDLRSWGTKHGSDGGAGQQIKATDFSPKKEVVQREDQKGVSNGEK